MDNTSNVARSAAVGSELHNVIEDAGHFVQEDAGERIGNLIAGWLRARGVAR